LGDEDIDQVFPLLGAELVIRTDEGAAWMRNDLRKDVMEIVLKSALSIMVGHQWSN
jgi:hypothetical protein